MTRAAKTYLASSWGYALFTDVSVNPPRKRGVGGYLAIPVSLLSVPPDAIEPADIVERLVMRKVEDTSSTKLEVQTIVWALEEHRDTLHWPGAAKLLIFSDSQCVAGLSGRRATLEARDYMSKRTQRQLPNATLYRRFYELADELGLEVIKVAGHGCSHSHDTAHRIFSIVDKEVRKELRHWVDNLNEPTPPQNIE